MSRLKLILGDTVIGQLYQGISFYQNMGRMRLMGTALSSSIIRNFFILYFISIIFRESNAIGVVIVGLGASLLAYVALRIRVHSLDYVRRRPERFANQSRRKSYFEVMNVGDSIFGFLCVVVGFSLRISSPIVYL
jgi:hypothetical protein